uniref:Uncharacterized protein n=1 Tax=Steinernema glaseri TaxID=37863 RepID=A0A1I8AJQ2_9BILA
MESKSDHDEVAPGRHMTTGRPEDQVGRRIIMMVQTTEERIPGKKNPELYRPVDHPLSLLNPKRFSFI